MRGICQIYYWKLELSQLDHWKDVSISKLLTTSPFGGVWGISFSSLAMFLTYIFLGLLRGSFFNNALFSLFVFLVVVHLQRRALLSWRWYWIYAGRKGRNYLLNDMRQAIEKWQKANKQKNERAWVIQRQLSKADCGCLMRRGMHWAQYASGRAYRFARTVICRFRPIVPAIIPTATMRSSTSSTQFAFP